MLHHVGRAHVAACDHVVGIDQLSGELVGRVLSNVCYLLLDTGLLALLLLEVLAALLLAGQVALGYRLAALEPGHPLGKVDLLAVGGRHPVGCAEGDAHLAVSGGNGLRGGVLDVDRNVVLAGGGSGHRRCHEGSLGDAMDLDADLADFREVDVLPAHCAQRMAFRQGRRNRGLAHALEDQLGGAAIGVRSEELPALRLVGLCGVEAALEAGMPDLLPLPYASEEVVEGGIEVHGRIAERRGVGLLEPKVPVLVQAGVLEHRQLLAGDPAHGLGLRVVGLVHALLPNGLAVGVLHVLRVLCVGICARCELGAAERLLCALPGLGADT